MVNNVTSLTGNGLKDWLVQRVTAVYIGFYAVFLFAYVACSDSVTYESWRLLFHCVSVKVASLLALTAVLLHAWVGVWTVTTDYLKCTMLRVGVQMLVVLYIASLFVWGIHILWGA